VLVGITGEVKGNREDTIVMSILDVKNEEDARIHRYSKIIVSEEDSYTRDMGQ